MHTKHWSRQMARKRGGWYEEENAPRFIAGGCCDPHDDLRSMALAHRGRHGRRHGGGIFGFGGPGGPFGPFGGNPFTRRPRARRGDVRAAILVLLLEQPLNGYQVMQELEQRSQGAWRPSPGSVYPALQQLQDERLIRAEDGGGGNVFGLTEAGEAEARKIAAAGEAPWEALAQEQDDGHVALFHQLRQIALACYQIAHAGDRRQAGKATRVLSDARKALYAILAQDPDDE